MRSHKLPSGEARYRNRWQQSFGGRRRESFVGASRVAAIQMDSAPTADSQAGTGSQAASMFQTHSAAVRLTRHLNFQRADSTAVSWLTSNF
jgi:hypothetical protein